MTMLKNRSKPIQPEASLLRSTWIPCTLSTSPASLIHKERQFLFILEHLSGFCAK
ncbi:hypothetical protein BDW66DRAFT_142112 [Aspergillus desertorum]